MGRLVLCGGSGRPAARRSADIGWQRDRLRLATLRKLGQGRSSCASSSSMAQICETVNCVSGSSEAVPLSQWMQMTSMLVLHC